MNVNENGAAEFKPTLRWCIRRWDRWPWTPGSVVAIFGAQPWRVEVLENGLVAAWDPVGSSEVTTTLRPSRWMFLAVLLGLYHVEFRVRRDRQRKEPVGVVLATTDPEEDR